MTESTPETAASDPQPAVQTERMQLGLLTNDDGSWSLQDKHGNVVCVGPALSRQLMVDLLTRAMGQGQEVDVPVPADRKPDAGPTLVVPSAGGIDLPPAEHIVVPGRTREVTT